MSFSSENQIIPVKHSDMMIYIEVFRIQKELEKMKWHVLNVTPIIFKSVLLFSILLVLLKSVQKRKPFYPVEVPFLANLAKSYETSVQNIAAAGATDG